MITWQTRIDPDHDPHASDLLLRGGENRPKYKFAAWVDQEIQRNSIRFVRLVYGNSVLILVYLYKSVTHTHTPPMSVLSENESILGEYMHLHRRNKLHKRIG